MVRSLCMGPVVVVLALTGLAWGQPEPASAPPKELRQAVITVQEPEKPNLKARVLATWLQADGSRAFQVQALTSGEMMTVVEVGPHTRTPGANGKFFQAVATRIYHWGGTVPPAGVPMPPENHPVVAFQPTPPVSSAPTGVQMVRPTVEPARRLASNGSASRVSNENRVWPPAYGTCANCTQDPINPARAQTPPQASVGISPYTRPGRAMVAQPPVPSQPIPVVRTTPTLTAPGSQPAYPPVVTVKSVVASNGQTSEGGTVNLNHTEPVPLPVIGEEPSWPRRTLRESTTLVSQASTPNCVCDTIATPASTSPPRMGQAPTIIQRDIIQPAKSVQVRTTPQGYPAGSSQLVSQVASPNCACDTITTTTTPPPVRVVRTPVIIQKEGIQPSQPVPMRTLTQRNQTVSGPLVSQGLSPKCECETVAITKSPPGRNSQMPVMTGNDQPSAPRVVYVPAPPIITAPAPSTTTAGLASQGVPPGLIPKSPASQPGNATKSPYAVVDASTEKPKQAWTGGLLPRVFGWKDESKTAANGTGSGSTVVSRVTEPVRPANSSVGQPTPTDVNGGKNIWGNTPIVQSPLSPPVKPTQIGSTNPSMSTGQVVAGQQNPMLPRLDPPAIQTQTASSLTLAPPTGSSNPATPTTPVVGIPQNSTLLARLDPPSIQSQLGSSLPAPNPNATPSAATPATPVKPTSTAPAKPPVPENQEQTGPRPVIPFADKSKPDPLEDLGSYTKIPGLEGKLTTPKYNAAVDSGYRVKGNQSSPAPANQANPAASNGSGIPAGANTPLVKPVAPITPVAPVTPITPVAPLPENPVASSIKPTPPSATLPQTPVTPVSPVTRTGAVVPPATTTAVNVPPAPPMRAPATAPLPPGNASQAISAPAGRQSIMAAQAAAQQVTNESRHVPGAAAPISVSALEGNAFSPPAAPQGSTQPAQASVVQRTAGTSGPAPGSPLPPGGPMMPYGPPARGPYQGPAGPMMGMQPPPFSPVRCPIPTGYANAFTQAGNHNPIPADANSDVSNTENAFQSIQGATLPVPVQGFSNVPSTFPNPDVPVSAPLESGATVDPNLAAMRGHERDSLASKSSNGGIVPVSAQVAVPGHLEDVKNPVSLPELLAILNDSLYPSQREVAAENLCSFDWRVHPQVAEVLLHAAQIDPAPMVRIACIHTLVKQKATTTYCVQALQTIKTSDKNEQVRKEAETALRALTQTEPPSSAARSAAR